MQCPIVESISIIGTKPRLLIIRYLGSSGELGFNDLKKLCSLSSRTLSLNLKFLSSKGIVDVRESKNRRLYFLTKKGIDILPALQEIGDWCKKWHPILKH